MKYSVIIPIYNAECTLKRCLDSLLSQLNSSIEVLLINDGSTDSSSDICKEYLSRSECFKYYEQENVGVSAARNIGLENAKGEYILFVDSDDYVTDDYFERISYYINDNNPDLLLFGAKYLNRSAFTIVSYDNDMSYSGKEIAPHYFSLYKQDKVYTLWNKVFKNKIISENKIYFDSKLHVGEDAVFIFHYFLYTNLLAECKDVLYFVDESNQNSLSRKRRKDLCYELIAATEIMEDYLNESSQDAMCSDFYKRCITWGHYRGAYACFNDVIKYSSNKKEINSVIKKICDQYRINVIKPVGLEATIISIPVLWKKVQLIRLLFYIKNKRAK